MNAHPYADIFPMLDDAGLADLAEDIKAHGQREPVVIYRGQVLDGRNRVRACELAGVPIRTIPAAVTTDEEALALVLSLNLHRRHLSDSQRAMVGAEILPHLEALAAERRRLGAIAGGAAGRSSKEVADLPPPAKPKRLARDEAGEAVNVSSRAIQNAKKVKDEAESEVVQAVRGGWLGVTPAAQISKMEPEEQREVVQALTSGEAKNAAQAIRAVEAKRAPHVTHNSGENEWYTPAAYVDAARWAMGGIELDPATSLIANKTVQAERVYTIDDDGLAHTWEAATLWMNPPYEKGLIDKFADKLAAEVVAGNVKQACVLVNNATETKWFRALCSVASAICFPTGRVRFISPDGVKGAPLQGQAVVYIGSNVSDFLRAYETFGLVVVVHHGAV